MRETNVPTAILMLERAVCSWVRDISSSFGSAPVGGPLVATGKFDGGKLGLGGIRTRSTLDIAPIISL
ncbi:hypothetical protein GCM10025779_17930 [Arthrobacter cryoconiti]